MVLIAPDAGALFVWRQFTESGRTARAGDISLRLPEGERVSWPAPELILPAERFAWPRWPGERPYTGLR